MTTNTAPKGAQMSVHYSATATAATYTITREVAGGAFTPRVDGVAIRPAGRLREARSAAARHNGAALDWVNEVKLRYA